MVQKWQLADIEENDAVFDAVTKLLKDKPKIKKGTIVTLQNGKQIKLKNSFVRIENPRMPGHFETYALANKRYNDPLGEGAYGKVKLAQDKKGNNFAVKIEGRGKRGEEDAELKIMQAIGYTKGEEARLLEEAKEFKGAQTTQKLYTMMELQEGKELFNLLYKNALTPDALIYEPGKPTRINPEKSLTNIQKLMVAVKAAQAVQDLHNRNVIHGDLKPANFMANVQGEQIIVGAIDFGFSFQVDGPGATIESDKGIPEGTSKAYMPPEVTAGDTRNKDYDGKTKAKFSAKSDIYSLGIMFRDDLGLDPELCSKMLSQNPQDRLSLPEVIKELTRNLASNLDLEQEENKQAKELVQEVQAGVRQIQIDNGPKRQTTLVAQMLSGFRDPVGSVGSTLMTSYTTSDYRTIAMSIYARIPPLDNEKSVGLFTQVQNAYDEIQNSEDKAIFLHNTKILFSELISANAGPKYLPETEAGIRRFYAHAKENSKGTQYEFDSAEKALSDQITHAKKTNKSIQEEQEQPLQPGSKSVSNAINENSTPEMRSQAAKEIAQDLKEIQLRGIRQLDLSSMHNENWTKRKHLATSLISMIDIFNNTSNMVRNDILTAETMEEQKRIFELYINVAIEAIELKDYSTAFAINAALQSSSVNRLEYLRSNPNLKEKITLLNQITSTGKNFNNVRMAHNNALDTQECSVPYIGILLQDLTFIGGNPDQTKDGRDNESKFLQEGPLIEFMLEIQSRAIQAEPKAYTFDVVTGVSNSSTLDENTQYKYSRARSPKDPIKLDSFSSLDDVKNKFELGILPFELKVQKSTGKVLEGEEAFIQLLKSTLKHYKKMPLEDRIEGSTANKILDALEQWAKHNGCYNEKVIKKISKARNNMLISQKEIDLVSQLSAIKRNYSRTDQAGRGKILKNLSLLEKDSPNPYVKEMATKYKKEFEAIDFAEKLQKDFEEFDLALPAATDMHANHQKLIQLNEIVKLAITREKSENAYIKRLAEDILKTINDRNTPEGKYYLQLRENIYSNIDLFVQAYKDLYIDSANNPSNKVENSKKQQGMRETLSILMADPNTKGKASKTNDIILKKLHKLKDSQAADFTAEPDAENPNQALITAAKTIYSLIEDDNSVVKKWATDLASDDAKKWLDFGEALDKAKAIQNEKEAISQIAHKLYGPMVKLATGLQDAPSKKEVEDTMTELATTYNAVLKELEDRPQSDNADIQKHTAKTVAEIKENYNAYTDKFKDYILEPQKRKRSASLPISSGDKKSLRQRVLSGIGPNLSKKKKKQKTEPPIVSTQTELTRDDDKEVVADTNVGVDEVKATADTGTGVGEVEATVDTGTGVGDVEATADTGVGVGEVEAVVDTRANAEVEATVDTGVGVGDVDASADKGVGVGDVETTADTEAGVDVDAENSQALQQQKDKIDAIPEKLYALIVKTLIDKPKDTKKEKHLTQARTALERQYDLCNRQLDKIIKNHEDTNSAVIDYAKKAKDNLRDLYNLNIAEIEEPHQRPKKAKQISKEASSGTIPVRKKKVAIDAADFAQLSSSQKKMYETYHLTLEEIRILELYGQRSVEHLQSWQKRFLLIENSKQFENTIGSIESDFTAVFPSSDQTSLLRKVAVHLASDLLESDSDLSLQETSERVQLALINNMMENGNEYEAYGQTICDIHSKIAQIGDESNKAKYRDIMVKLSGKAKLSSKQKKTKSAAQQTMLPRDQIISGQVKSWFSGINAMQSEVKSAQEMLALYEDYIKQYTGTVLDDNGGLTPEFTSDFRQAHPNQKCLADTVSYTSMLFDKVVQHVVAKEKLQQDTVTTPGHEGNPMHMGLEEAVPQAQAERAIETNADILMAQLRTPEIPAQVQQLADTGFSNKDKTTQRNIGTWINDTFNQTEETIRTNLRDIPAPNTYTLATISSAMQTQPPSTADTLPNFTIVQGVSVNDLHKVPLGQNCVLQVASQFDFQESVGAFDAPVTSYLIDRTQGPQASIEAAAAALHRKAAKDAGNLPNALIDLIPEDIQQKYPGLYKHGYLRLSVITSEDDKLRLLQHIADNIEKLRILPQDVICETTQAKQLQVFCAAPSFQSATTPQVGSTDDLICKKLVVAQYTATAQLAVIKARQTGKMVPLHLTMVGQGAFRNDPSVMQEALQSVAHVVKGENVAVFAHAYDEKAKKIIESQLESGKNTLYTTSYETKESFNQRTALEAKVETADTGADAEPIHTHPLTGDAYKIYNNLINTRKNEIKSYNTLLDIENLYAVFEKLPAKEKKGYSSKKEFTACMTLLNNIMLQQQLILKEIEKDQPDFEVLQKIAEDMKPLYVEYIAKSTKLALPPSVTKEIESHPSLSRVTLQRIMLQPYIQMTALPGLVGDIIKECPITDDAPLAPYLKGLKGLQTKFGDINSAIQQSQVDLASKPMTQILQQAITYHSKNDIQNSNRSLMLQLILMDVIGQMESNRTPNIEKAIIAAARLAARENQLTTNEILVAIPIKTEKGQNTRFAKMIEDIDEAMGQIKTPIENLHQKITDAIAADTAASLDTETPTVVKPQTTDEAQLTGVTQGQTAQLGQHRAAASNPFTALSQTEPSARTKETGATVTTTGQTQNAPPPKRRNLLAPQRRQQQVKKTQRTTTSIAENIDIQDIAKKALEAQSQGNSRIKEVKTFPTDSETKHGVMVSFKTDNPSIDVKTYAEDLGDNKVRFSIQKNMDDEHKKTGIKEMCYLAVAAADKDTVFNIPTFKDPDRQEFIMNCFKEAISQAKSQNKFPDGEPIIKLAGKPTPTPDPKKRRGPGGGDAAAAA